MNESKNAILLSFVSAYHSVITRKNLPSALAAGSGSVLGGQVNLDQSHSCSAGAVAPAHLPFT
jgi:hypothetical protein